MSKTGALSPQVQAIVAADMGLGPVNRDTKVDAKVADHGAPA